MISEWTLYLVAGWILAAAAAIVAAYWLIRLAVTHAIRAARSTNTGEEK